MSKRREGLDLLKLLCAFSVISAHKHFPKPAGPYIAVFARLTIPIFLMITGFFSLSQASGGHEGRPGYVMRGGYAGLLKLLKQILLANGLYFLIGICDHYADGTIPEYLHSVFNLQSMKDMLIFNKSPFGYHLWYLNALLYAMVIIITMDRLGLRKVLYFLTPFLIAGDFIFGRYSIFILGRYFPVTYTRNWLFIGIPSICLGMMLKEYDIVERTRKHRTAIGLGALALMAGSIYEYILFKGLIKGGTRVNYVCSVLASILLFIWFAQIGEFHSWVFKRLAALGRNASAGIYIVHVYYVDHLAVFMKQLGLTRLYKNMAPVVIFVVSAMTVCLYNAVKKFIIYMRKPTESKS